MIDIQFDIQYLCFNSITNLGYFLGIYIYSMSIYQNTRSIIYRKKVENDSAIADYKLQVMAGTTK